MYAEDIREEKKENGRMRTIILSVLMVVCTTLVHAGSFTDNGNGTVTDNTTGLVWQQCSAGLSGADCTTGMAGTYTWENAISYCESLSFGGYTDWRLPNIKELRSIADSTKNNPTIDIVYFPSTQWSGYLARYWSSTTHAYYTSYAWLVHFSDSSVDGDDKTDNYYVRCVRGGQ